MRRRIWGLLEEFGGAHSTSECHSLDHPTYDLMLISKFANKLDFRFKI